MIFVGNDWAEGHHDVYLMDDGGARLGFSRLGEGLAGVARFHEMVAKHASDRAGVVVGIETDRGLWVGALVGAGYVVYAINPMAVSRYRDRHSQGGAKSDRGDAKVLADLVRTDRYNHRRVAGDSPEAEGIKIMARAHQNLIWARVRHINQLRNALREYYPVARETFGDLAHSDALAVLGRAPTPTAGARLTLPQIRAALKAAGRKRNLEATARRIQKGLRTRHLAAADPIADAYGATVTSLAKITAEISRQITRLEATLATRFSQHPDADIYHSQPGLGTVLGARALGEFGDDPERYTNAKSPRNYAGTSPITIASGRKHTVVARHVRNRRLYDALDQWAYCSITNSPGARAFYDQKRAAGDLHHQALRALANRLVGILHGCLKHQTGSTSNTPPGHTEPPSTEPQLDNYAPGVSTRADGTCRSVRPADGNIRGLMERGQNNPATGRAWPTTPPRQGQVVAGKGPVRSTGFSRLFEL